MEEGSFYTPGAYIYKSTCAQGKTHELEPVVCGKAHGAVDEQIDYEYHGDGQRQPGDDVRKCGQQTFCHSSHSFGIYMMLLTGLPPFAGEFTVILPLFQTMTED